MAQRTVTVAAVLLVLSVLSAGIASACATLDDKVDAERLVTQHPIQGPQVRRTIAYGSRNLGNRIKTRAGFTYEASVGTPVVAVHAGRVRSAQNEGQYGNVIVLEHGAGMETLYAFLDHHGLRVGDCVAQGAIMARIGSPPAGRKPSLYFEVSDDGHFHYVVDQIPMR